MFICFNTSYAEQKEEPVIRGVWKENKTLTIKNTKILIPSYLPFQYPQKGPVKYYWATEPTDAYWPNYRIDFSKVPDCNGSHSCSHANFAVFSLSKDLALFMEDILSSKYQTVDVNSVGDGYYIPSVCYAYCSTNKLVWFSQGKMFTIASIAGGDDKRNIAELKKSALSLINNTLTKKTK